ncbi:glycosyltransferase [Clostridium perfringens]|uniref:glycosyltransferase n=1 Tax=Clostridium perfringens TaxID=1502 RepID=UPI000F8D1088|nr:glycosyltransferase [Clostridium perfringens]RUR35228.1 glycosyltransferase [Clostridium perfringens]
MKKIVSLLIGEIKYDGRVQKEIQSLIKNKYDVSLIVHKFCNDNINNYNYPIIAISTNDNTPTMPGILKKFRFCFDAYKILKNINPDIVHCNDLTTLYAGVMYKNFNKKCKIIYDAHELYPEMFCGFRKFLWNCIEKLNIKKVDEIISPEINRALYMKNKYKLNKDIHVIENLPNKFKNIEFNHIEKKYPETIGKIKILYLGLLSKDRGILEMINSMKYVSDENILVLVGNFVNDSFKSEVINLIKNERLENKVKILGRVPNNQVINYVQSSDIGLIFYENINLNNYYCASNKLYEFLVSKKFIITNDYPGLINTVEKNNMGKCIKSIDCKLIADAIKDYKVNILMSNKTSDFTWESQENKFIKIYE